MTLSTQDGPGLSLEDVLGPVRDQYLVAFLNAVRRAQNNGNEPDVEPVRHDTDGTIIRSGLLNLPARCDCAGDADGQNRTLRMEPLTLLHQEPYRFVIGGTLTCEIEPFHWHDVWLSTAPTCHSALLMRLRLWYLDWFQDRIVDASDTLSGAVHRLNGPMEHDSCHWFHLDLGTAPLEALTTLLDLLSAGQIRLCAIGQRPAFE